MTLAEKLRMEAKKAGKREEEFLEYLFATIDEVSSPEIETIKEIVDQTLSQKEREAFLTEC